jgi:uncharacterized protein YidB (DUF937 family)
MGLLDSVLGAMNGAGDDGKAAGAGGLGGLLGTLTSNPQVVQAVIGMLGNDGPVGGLSGLLARFQQAGLGELVQSWIGGGANLPVSGPQIEQALGSDALSGVASQLGTSQPEAASQLAQVLPGLIDKLTPSGEAPAGGLGNSADLMGMLGGLLGKS